MILTVFTSGMRTNGHSAAMVARLVGVPVAMVHRWTRRGYLRVQDAEAPIRTYAFEQLPAAKALARVLQQGVTPGRLDRVIDQLRASVGDPDVMVTDYDFEVHGESVIVHRHGQPCDPSGQRLLKFEPSAQAQQQDLAPLPFPGVGDDAATLRAHAEEALLADDLPRAEECWRALLFAGLGQADDHFGLAETLYRKGELTAARERYLVCLELNDRRVEARLCLGSLYAELGEFDLAVSSLEGVLTIAPGSVDALSQLVALYDRLGKPERAEPLRQRLLEAAPDGGWAEQVGGTARTVGEGDSQVENPAH